MAETKTRESLLPAILQGTGLKLADSEMMGEQIAARIAQADSADELLDLAGTVSTDEIIGLPVKLRDVQLAESTIEDGIPVYMLLDVVDLATGEVFVVTTSAAEVMVKAAKLKQIGALPVDIKVIEKRAAAPGKNAPLSIVRADWEPRARRGQ